MKITRRVPGRCRAPYRPDRSDLLIEISTTPEADRSAYCFVITCAACGWTDHFPAVRHSQPHADAQLIEYAVVYHLGQPWRFEL